MRILRTVPWALAALAFLAACTHPARGLKSCRYTFKELAFLGMDAGATHWKIKLAVANPNTHQVTLTRLKYSLLHGADTLLSGWNPAQRVVPAGDSITAEATLDVPNAVWQRLPPGIWSRKDAAFTIVADAYLNTWLGDLVVTDALRQTVHVDMTKQVERVRDMMMQKLFSWPTRKLHEGGTVGPDTTTPSPLPRPGSEEQL